MVTIEPAAETPDGLSCLEYRENGACAGRIFYRTAGETAELLCLEAGEPVTADALIRAALSAAELRGARTVMCENSALFSGLSQVGFVKSDKGMSISLREFFDHPCRSHG